MSQERRSTIAVGVDGSVESMVAARWAAQEAQRRHTSLKMILAINEPLKGHSDYVFPPPVLAAIRTVNRERLEHAAAAIRAEYPTLSVQTSLDLTDPRLVLVSHTKEVVLTAVGTRGRGRLPEVLVGSVALYVAAHAHSPVAVIPPSADVSGNGPSGPVMVGVDGRPDCAAAIGFAFDEAAVRDTELLAALVFDDLAYRGFAKGANQIGKVEDDEEQAVLAEQVAGWREKYPDVPVREVVLRGRPAERLIDYADEGPEVQHPQVIVVGTRGRGGIAGVLLGSTSQRLMTHTQVPVVVVPPTIDL